MAMRSTSTSETACEQGWRDVDVSEQEEEIVVSVVLVVVRRSVIAAGPHSSTAEGLRTENAVCVPVWTVLTWANMKSAEEKLGMTMIT